MIRDSKESMSAYAAYFGRNAADEIRAASFVSFQRGFDEGLIMGLVIDMCVRGQYHGDNAKELIYRKNYSNVPAMEILKEATINSAIIMKEQDIDPAEDISCMYGGVVMVEVLPAYDQSEITAYMAANIIFEFLSILALQRNSRKR